MAARTLSWFRVQLKRMISTMMSLILDVLELQA